MPELPEVETVVRSLGDFLPGQKIAQIQIHRSKSFPQGSQFAQSHLLGAKVTHLSRRAKFIQIHLDNQLQLLIHLKMTGQLIFVSGQNSHQTAGGGHPTADWTHQLPGPHTRLTFTFSSGDHLYFNDQRVFGWVQALTQKQIDQLYFSSLGPDANTTDFNSAYLAPKLAKKRIPIKTAIMDNKIVTGIGNIYAAEILFAARINPLRPAQEITPTELEKITTLSHQILDQAIKVGGTTFDGKYVDATGQAGNYSEQLQVYGRAGENCLVCHQPLTAIKLGGRSTVYCPHCQK